MMNLYKNRYSSITITRDTISLLWENEVVFVVNSHVNLRTLVPLNANDPSMPAGKLAEEYERFDD